MPGVQGKAMLPLKQKRALRGVVLTYFQNQQADAPLPPAFPQLQLTDPIHCNYIMFGGSFFKSSSLFKAT